MIGVGEVRVRAAGAIAGELEHLGPERGEDPLAAGSDGVAASSSSR